MIGDVIIVNGEEFEVIWSGGEGLIGDRETKSMGIWVPPKRLYNKKSDYWTIPRTKSGVAPQDIDNPLDEPSNSNQAAQGGLE